MNKVNWHNVVFGQPDIPVGESARFWVAFRAPDGEIRVTDLTWFNHQQPEDA